MGLGDDFNFYGYTSDDGNDYSVKLSAEVAAAGGFGTAIAASSLPGWPYGPKNMRHVWGISVAGKRTRLPCKTGANATFVGGGTFTVHSVVYTVQGAIGEARKLNNIGG